MDRIVKKAVSLKQKFNRFPLLFKLAIIAGIGIFGFFTYNRFAKSSQSTPQYQTAKAEKGTLIVSISTSGQIATANSVSVTTQSSGVVSKIYVENGQKVASGDPIAQLDLDMVGKQRYNQALASYQSAKNALDTANANLYTTQADMLTKWKTYMDTAQNSTYQNPDGSPNSANRNLSQFYVTSDEWLASEAKYIIQQNAIVQAQTSLNAAWASYQQSSPVVYAPITGTVTVFSLQLGSVLTAQSNTSGTSTSQKIASVLTDATPTVSINLTEVDVPKVKIGDKATITLDAFADKTYTGKVISIDTVGTVSSGVTTYPTVIKLDSKASELLTNMTAEANIITQVVDEAILVPVAAVTTQNGSSTVRVLKNGAVTNVTVEAGASNDTLTEIKSGISEGDEVVTSTVNSASTTTGNSSSSPFGGFGGARFVGPR